jgi:hypothetical protein
MADKKVGTGTGKKTQAGRDVYKTPEGEMVSEKSTTFKYKNKWINVPSIHSGVQYDDDTLILMLEAGKISPTSTHNTVKEAVSAARKRSESLEFNKGGTPMLGKQMELFADGGLKDEGGSVDKESGNDVPVGSLKEEVRDDIDAKLSEGEFVLPADVVRFYGLAHIMKMRDVAKAGLAKMDAMGQMGNSDQATMEDDMPFSMEDLEVEDEEGNSMAYADGGYVRNFEVGGYNPATGTTTTGNTGISYMPASTFGTPVAPVTPVNPTVNTTMPQYNLQAAPQGGFTYKMPEGFTTPVLPKQQDVLGTKDGLPPSTKMGKYTNAAGETMEIPLDGLGNPLYDVPVGYTRVDEAPAAPAPVAPSIEAPTAPTQKNDGDNDNVPEQKPKSIKWDNLNYDELVKVGTEITSPAAKTAMAIFSAIPVIGGFAAMAGANQNKKLRTAIQNEFLNPTTASDPAKLEQLNTLWDNSKSFLGTLLGTNKQTLAESMAAAKLKDPKLKYNAPAAKAQVSAVQTVANAAIAKLLAGSNGGYVADQLDRGYIGSTIGGVAIGPDGKVVSLDKNGKPTGAGVVATADGKVMRDPDTNRTVYADSQGNMYTSGLFGMNKKNLDGTAYKGPGDAKTAPVTNTVAAQPAPKPALKPAPTNFPMIGMILPLPLLKKLQVIVIPLVLVIEQIVHQLLLLKKLQVIVIPLVLVIEQIVHQLLLKKKVYQRKYLGAVGLLKAA